MVRKGIRNGYTTLNVNKPKNVSPLSTQFGKRVRPLAIKSLLLDMKIRLFNPSFARLRARA